MLIAVFISRSQGRGHARAQAVLDRYALRIGDGTWQTSITQDGLSVLRKHLRRVATRQVAVSCFLRTPRGLMYRWSVGKKIAMQEDGSIPVHTGKIKRRQEVPVWLTLACLLNEAAGLAHDFGKAGNAFQDKLRQAAATGAIIADPVRHEWISMHMLDAIIRGDAWDDAWQEAQTTLRKNGSTGSLEGTPFKRCEKATASTTPPKGISTKKKVQVSSSLPPQASMNDWRSYLYFIVGSHHRLPKNRNDPSHFSLKGDRPETFNLEVAADSQTFFAGEAPLKKVLTPTEQQQMAYRHAVSEGLLKQFRTVVGRIEKKVATLPQSTQNDPDFWLAMAFMSRPAFILADHDRSSVVLNKGSTSGTTVASEGQPSTQDIDATRLFANTTRGPDGNKSLLNQTLDWHLNAVGDYARKILVEGLVGMNLPSMPIDVVAHLAADTTSARHAWQNTSARALRQDSSEVDAGPVLMFNMAGTGQGKTRMNMRLLATLAQHQRKPLRVATMLNLRSLTLQTFDAYEQQLGLERSLLAGVIGDHVARQMHETGKVNAKDVLRLEQDDEGYLVADADGNPVVPEFEVAGSNDWDDEAPGWLQHALHAKPDLKKVVMAPVAVCTTDFLVTGGDLTRQGNHALAFLRLASSDLILDEIDSYDPNALVAVARVVMLAALCGRNVVASSATLTEECAQTLWMAWKRGIAMRKALHSIGDEPSNLQVNVLLLDHLQDPVWLPVLPMNTTSATSKLNFDRTYRGFLATMMEKVRVSSLTQTPRLAKIIEIQGLQKNAAGQPIQAEENREALYATILAQAKVFHHAHGFTLDDHTVSFGLVRVANINVAIPLAEYIAEQTQAWPDITVKVACYHSRTTRMRRHFVEQRLDTLLQRSAGAKSALFKDVGLKADLKVAKPHVMFIVVATPVEEIGRDHDFDYGIAEPSSTQSLVQTPGRVNRHRQVHVTTANFAILNYNMRTIVPAKGPTKKSHNYFCRPGLDDNQKAPFARNCSEASMVNMLGYQIDKVWPIDARLKFSRHINGNHLLQRRLAQLESQALQRRLKDVFEILDNPLHQAHFLQTGLYRFFVLREKEKGEEEHLVEFIDTYAESGNRRVMEHVYQKADKRMKENTMTITQKTRVLNDWLVLDDELCENMAEQMGLSNKDAMSVTLKLRTGQSIDGATWHASFGMLV